MTREEAIMHIDAMINTTIIVKGIVPDEYDIEALRMAIEALSAEAVQGWIPCSEGLPEAEYGEGDCVLTTCCWKSDTKQRWIEKLYFDGGNWCRPTGERFTHKVIAWKPLPEPYREDGEI